MVGRMKTEIRESERGREGKGREGKGREGKGREGECGQDVQSGVQNESTCCLYVFTWSSLTERKEKCELCCVTT